MRKFFNDHYAFFSCLLVFVMAGGAYTLLSEKPDATWFFSENRMDWADACFKTITWLGEEPLYFIVGIGMLLASRLRHAVLIALTGFSVMGISSLLKFFFAQERPFTFFDRNGILDSVNLVEGVDLLVGRSSFPSGHSMSAFALCSLLVFLLPKRKWYAIALFGFALLVALSRVYLVQHFWRDVFAGALAGVLLAMVVYAVNRRVNSW